MFWLVFKILLNLTISFLYWVLNRNGSLSQPKRRDLMICAFWLCRSGWLEPWYSPNEAKLILELSNTHSLWSFHFSRRPCKPKF